MLQLEAFQFATSADRSFGSGGGGPGAHHQPTGCHDTRHTDQLQGFEVLAEHEQPGEGGNSRCEAQQDSEDVGGQSPQGDELQRVGQDRGQHGDDGASPERAGGPQC